ncbi:MAG TPA: hypothetical protein PKL83_05190 [bacterium]|nr:hypothetical protein [bacterium]
MTLEQPMKWTEYIEALGVIPVPSHLRQDENPAPFTFDTPEAQQQMMETIMPHLGRTLAADWLEQVLEAQLDQQRPHVDITPELIIEYFSQKDQDGTTAILNQEPFAPRRKSPEGEIVQDVDRAQTSYAGVMEICRIVATFQSMDEVQKSQFLNTYKKSKSRAKQAYDLE